MVHLVIIRIFQRLGMGLVLCGATLWILELLQGSYTLAYGLIQLLPSPPQEFEPVVAIWLTNSLICVLCGLWLQYNHQSWLTSLRTPPPPTERWIKRAIPAGGVIGYLIAIISLGWIFSSSSWGWPAISEVIRPMELALLVLLVPATEEILFRGYLRHGIHALWVRLWHPFHPDAMGEALDQKLQRGAGWSACLLFVICHIQPFANWPGQLSSEWRLPWGVILLSVACEGLRQLGYSTGLTIAIHVIANGSVYYFAAIAPDIFKLLPWLFLQAH